MSKNEQVKVGDVLTDRRCPSIRIRVERVIGSPVKMIAGRDVDTGVHVLGDIELYFREEENNYPPIALD